MNTYQTPMDVASRAIQHVGARRLISDTTIALWAADVSQEAAETYFSYDKVRQAELHRHLWRFSTRRCVLRAITSTTQLLTFGAFASTASAGDVMTDTSGAAWVALVANTTAPGPTTWPLWEEYTGPLVADTWSATVSYYAGELVLYSGSYYTSLINSNLNNTPGGAQWLVLTVQPAAQTVFIAGPLPANQAGATRNVYFLPSRFLRIAPQDPKAAGVANQDVTAGQMWSDLEIENTFLLTAQASPLIFRFAADIETIARFSPMFSEGVAARLGKEVAPRLNPLAEPACDAAYALAMTEARRINAFEIGSTDPLESGSPQAPQQGQQR